MSAYVLPPDAVVDEHVALVATASRRGELRVYDVAVEGEDDEDERAAVVLTLRAEISCTEGATDDGLVTCEFHPLSARRTLDGADAGAYGSHGVWW